MNTDDRKILNLTRPSARSSCVLQFGPKNKMKYGQDFRQHKGIPSGVDFAVERLSDTHYRLTGYGYGQLDSGDHKGYGNGKLYVWGLTPRQRARFENACNGVSA